MFGLFKWVEDLVNDVINQILSQVNIIQDVVTAPLRALVSAVLGGIWKGEGANRFVQEMTNDVIPMLVNIMGINTSYANAIKKSQDRMQQAVQQATSQANSLLDIFGNIF